MVLGALMSLTAAGVAAAETNTAAETKTTPATATANIAKDSAGRKIKFALYDQGGKAENAYRVTLAVNGGVPYDAYCIDIAHDLQQGGTYQEAGWDPNRVQQLAKVQWILVNSVPNKPVEQVLEAAKVTKPASVNSADLPLLVYAGTQGAIWHFSDGFNLGDRPGDDAYAVVKGVYDYLINNAVDAPEPAPTLRISPASITGQVGTKLGPYTVNTAGWAELTATGGKIVDANGVEITTRIANGGQFWLTGDVPGKVSVHAKGDGSVPIGRVFTYQGGADQAQKVILAGAAPIPLDADAEGTFTPRDAAAPPAPPAPGDAAPILPITGASTVGAAAGGAALLAGGAALVVVLRRRRMRFTA
jgi:TQXA domain-containing protein/LPXTG-motif cell wall-anchored protein